jgi:hypothetical protein
MFVQTPAAKGKSKQNKKIKCEMLMNHLQYTDLILFIPDCTLCSPQEGSMLAAELNTSPNEIMNISNELEARKDGTLLPEEALEKLRIN